MVKNDWAQIESSFQDDMYPQELLKNYELTECLSTSGSSEVLLARNRADQSLCVVKCYFADHPLFIRAESDSIKKIDHPLLPHFVAEYGNENVRCLLREYIAGQTLESTCRERKLSEKEVREIGIQLCDELDYLHTLSTPIIHRDIKPQNVILREDGRVSLIDFDISKAYRAENAGETIAFGTQGFAPPEQYGFSPTDRRSDLYSLGVLLRWLLRGNTECSDAANTPMEKVIAKCTAFDPAHRYDSAVQVKKALKYATEGWKAAKMTACIAAVLALVVLSGLLFSSRQNNTAPPPEEDPLIITKDETASELGFQSQPIYQAARASMGLNGREPLTAELLSKVETLYLVGDDPFADGDSFYAGVEKWYQNGQHKGEVNTLNDVLLMPYLREVCAVGQRLENISALAELKYLKKLEIKHNYVTDLSPLAGSHTLTYVGINGNPVTDLSPLTRCPGLRFLDVCDVDGYDGKVFADMGDFTVLDISNRTDSYQYLSGKEIRHLKIAWSSMDTLTWLDDVSGLVELEINNSKVTDLSPIVKHTALQALNIAGLAIDDLSPLLQLPNLQTVTISTDMDAAMEALGDVPFTVRYQ